MINNFKCCVSDQLMLMTNLSINVLDSHVDAQRRDISLELWSSFDEKLTHIYNTVKYCTTYVYADKLMGRQQCDFR